MSVVWVPLETVDSLRLPPDRTASAQARKYVRERMRAWGFDPAICDAELLVSELVTNSVLHARSSVRVEVVRVERGVRVAVYDDSPAVPRVRRYGPDAATGRGMLLVQRIAQRWGVEPCEYGKCVWFEFAVNAGASRLDREQVGEA